MSAPIPQLADLPTLEELLNDGTAKAWRRKHRREMLVHPLWWMYWKARHKTWRQRAKIRRGLSTVVDIVPAYVEFWRSPVK